MHFKFNSEDQYICIHLLVDGLSINIHHASGPEGLKFPHLNLIMLKSPMRCIYNNLIFNINLERWRPEVR